MQPDALTPELTKTIQQQLEIIKAQLWDTGFIPQRYRNDFAGFRKNILQRPILTKDQAQVAKLVSEHNRIAVKSGNGVGKTNVAASIALWWLYTRTPSMVISTAPTWHQVDDLLWGEIRSQFPSNGILPGRLLQTEIIVDVSERWQALGLSTRNEGNFQGYHSPNLLVIIDEGCVVPNWVYSAAESLATGANSKILTIGNPTDPSTEFGKIFRKGSKRWALYSINSLNHPNIIENANIIPGAVSREWIRMQIDDYCEPVHDNEDATCFQFDGQWFKPGPWFMAHVLGEFPTEASDALIPLCYLEAAAAREPFADHIDVIVAVDIARYGDDRTVISVWRGRNLIDIRVHIKQDLMTVVGLIRQVMQEHGAESVCVDAIGVGAGVADRLQELGLDCVAINVAESAINPERYYRLRDEIGWNYREMLREGQLSFATCAGTRELSDLIAESANVKYNASFGSTGTIKIESKDEMKKRGLRSPDIFDSVAMGAWFSRMRFELNTGRTSGSKLVMP